MKIKLIWTVRLAGNGALNNRWMTWCVLLKIHCQPPLELYSVLIFKPPNILAANICVHYTTHLVIAIQVCCSYPHLTACRYVLSCLWRVLAQSAVGVLSCVVDLRLYQPCAQQLFSCYLGKCLCAVPVSRLFYWHKPFPPSAAHGQQGHYFQLSAWIKDW